MDNPFWNTDNPEVDRIKQAVQALRHGDKAAARKLLADELRQNPRSENAWLVMAAVVDTPQQRKDCITRVLAINPHHPQAVQAYKEFETSPAEEEVLLPVEEPAQSGAGDSPETAPPEDIGPASDFSTNFEAPAQPDQQPAEMPLEVDPEQLDRSSFGEITWGELAEEGAAEGEEGLNARLGLGTDTEEHAGHATAHEVASPSWEPESYLENVETDEPETLTAGWLDTGPDLQSQPFPLETVVEENVHPEVPATLSSSAGCVTVGLISVFLLAGVLALFGGIFWAYQTWNDLGGQIPGNPLSAFGLPIGLALGGLILTIILSIVLVRSIDRTQFGSELNRDGKKTRGVIVRRWTEESASPENAQAFLVAYQFTLHPKSGGEEIFQIRQSVDEMLYNELAEGSEVPVRYLSRDPNVSRLDRKAS